ncbi:fasciclin-like arabinogalactan protein 10 [Quercus lobata]|nr:fasciclin-like arabinogalactan protein 10 [Quercus lobata]
MAAKVLTIFTVNKVLVPKELFGKSPSPAPALGPVMSLSPAPALAPSPVSEAPSPVKDMLPAPSPMETPSTSGSHVKGSVGMAVLVTSCATLISLFILS